MKSNLTPLILILAFAVLMSLPWLVPGMGFCALVAFIPLLWLEKIYSGKRFWLWQYSAFVLWNAFTTFWVCNATVGGGIFAVLANALQMAVIFGFFRLARKRLRGTLPYIFLMAAWIAWERWYMNSAQISWPWLVLGNAFAQTTRSVQWYEFTGTLGGSFWIWLSNLGIFGLLSAIHDRKVVNWNALARICSVLSLVVLLLGPMLYSAYRYNTYQERSEGTVETLVGQPNFDPYHKFELMTQDQQDGVLIDLFRSAADSSVQLMIAPETFTSRLWLSDVTGNTTFRNLSAMLSDYPDASLLFGASSYEIFNKRVAPSKLSRKWGDGWMESHNSAVMMDSDENYEVFHKSKLVIGTETIPYPSMFVPVDDLLGGVMGRCTGQDGISLLHTKSGAAIGCAVCYESVYGEYCTGYENAGADAIAVITNDAWWGDTPGYRQHFSYSSLRAIELRRDVARCGNTGISALIDQKGDVVCRTPWWEPATLRFTVNLNTQKTFFAIHGDIIGRVCTLAFLLLLSLLVVKSFVREKN